MKSSARCEIWFQVSTSQPRWSSTIRRVSKGKSIHRKTVICSDETLGMDEKPGGKPSKRGNTQSLDNVLVKVLGGLGLVAYP